MAPPSRRRSSPPHALAFTEGARGLAKEGLPIDMFGTVIQARPRGAAATALAVAALAAFTGLVAPLLSLAVIAACMAAMRLDLDGGQSWLRRLAPRVPGRTALLGLRPGQVPDAERVVLVCLPAEAEVAAPPRRGPLVLSAVLAGALLAALAAYTAAPHHAAVALEVVGGLALAGALASAVTGRRSPRGDHAAGLRLGAVLWRACQPLQTDRCAVVVAVSQGVEPFYDPIETLLLNNAPRLSPDRTVVLVWQPGAGPPELVTQEGALFSRGAPGLLVEAANALSLPPTRGVTAAARAARCGWRAAAVRGGLDQPKQVPQVLTALVKGLVNGVGQGRW